MNSRDQALALGTSIDALVVVSVTVLGGLHVIPGTALAGLLFAFVFPHHHGDA
jgi:branched-subunit amino acid ABC-type transport system permease component